ncbi:DedA family protein [Actinoplanes couchii]|uniref:DedA family protein n=1 Tax=Actinoplanes couchii TaxID=403638 RepID=A0ABQ3X7W2_9ACTN|nr:DedA family protein [Actinoplanes couchii]MDR6320396.1 membrane protein DedA with SNARE-associated domain [Actinoplanes couchii]GID54592.1 DedA family protein [Actinoplanes couchii]
MGGITDWVTEWVFRLVDALGEVGVGLLLFLETVIPPIPSELILPLAGFHARSGDLNLVLVWITATIGAVAGAVVLYYVGALLGYDRLHQLAGKRWFVLATRADVERGYALFEKYGTWLVLVARCVPIVRSLISLPAGVARMSLTKFIAFTTVGSGIWNAALIGAGWALADNWDSVEGYLSPFSKIVLALGVSFVIFLVVRRVLARKRARAEGVDPAEADVDGHQAADFDGLGSPNHYPTQRHPARGTARVTDHHH